MARAQRTVRADEVKVGDFVRNTLADEFQQVGKIERPTPKFVRILNLEGRQITHENQGGKLWKAED